MPDEKSTQYAGAAQQERSHCFSFVKEGQRWYIDLPEYLEQGGSKAHLEMVEGAGELLDFLAKRKSVVTLQLDTAPFEEADELELIELCDAPKGGGYYLLRTYRNRTVDKTIWLCDVVLFVFGDMPERIYIKKVSRAHL